MVLWNSQDFGEIQTQTMCVMQLNKAKSTVVKSTVWNFALGLCKEIISERNFVAENCEIYVIISQS